MASFLKSIARKIQLRRHGRGFGIHSPFAFNFVTQVLHQPYAYYSYDKLDDRVSRLVYRVALAVEPCDIYVCASPMDGKAARMAFSQASRNTPGFVLIDTAFASPGQFSKGLELLKSGWTLMKIGSDTYPGLEETLETLPHGMTFDNCAGTVVAVPYAHLPRQNFIVKY